MATPTSDHVPERAPAHDVATPEVQHDQGGAPAPLPAYAPGLLRDPRLLGRGNGAVRQAAVQRMQATLGNRATRRALTGGVPIQRLVVQVDRHSATPKNAYQVTAGDEVVEMVATLQHDTGQQAVDFYGAGQTFTTGEHWFAGHGHSSAFDDMTYEEFAAAMQLRGHKVEGGTTLHFISCNVGQKKSADDFAKKLRTELADLKYGVLINANKGPIKTTGAPAYVHHTRQAKAVYNPSKLEKDEKAPYKEAMKDLTQQQQALDAGAVDMLRQPLREALALHTPTAQHLGLADFTQVVGQNHPYYQVPVPNAPADGEADPVVLGDWLLLVADKMPSGWLAAIEGVVQKLNDAILSGVYGQALGQMRQEAHKLWPVHDLTLGKWLQTLGPQLEGAKAKAAVKLYDVQNLFKNEAYNKFG